MIRLITCFIVLVLLNACISSTKTWQGSSNKTSAQANFQSLIGRQVFKLVVPTNDEFLKYRISVKEGKLRAAIKADSKYVLDKSITKLEDDSIKVVNQKGIVYTFYLDGSHASGRFDLLFTSTVKEMNQ